MEKSTYRCLIILFSCFAITYLHSYFYTVVMDPISMNLIQYKAEFSSRYIIKPKFDSISSLDGNLNSFSGNISRRNMISEGRNQTIWISMGLCFGKNTHRYGKKNYPYTKVAPLAILLWNYFVPSVKIMFYIIYDLDSNKEHRDVYEFELRRIINKNKVAIRWIESKDMECPLKSQLIRLWAFQEDIINDNDIIVTVDANLFAMSSDILDPIFQNSDMNIWVFQYDRAENKSKGFGETFNQNLIAARAKGILIIIFQIVNVKGLL